MSQETMLDVLTNAYETRKKPLQKSLDSLTQKRDALEASLMRMSESLYGTPQIHDPRKSWWSNVVVLCFMLIVAFGEMPFNRVALEVLGLNTDETQYVAIAVGVIMAGIAWATGYYLKRAWVTLKPKNVVVGFLLVIISIGGIFTLSLMREKYLAASGSDVFLAPWIQTLLTYMIFMGGVLVEFFFSSSVKNLEEEKAYKKKYVEYAQTSIKILETEKSIEALNEELQEKLESETNIMVEQQRTTVSRNNSNRVREEKIIPSSPDKGFEQLSNSLSGEIDTQAEYPNDIGHPWNSFFKMSRRSWVSANVEIERKLNDVKNGRVQLYESDAELLMNQIQSQEEKIPSIEESFRERRDSQSDWSTWIQAKELFFHLKNRAENEIL